MHINIDWELFDIKGYLDDRGINYTAQGKNVSRDFIGTACPFCGDKSNHLGINLSTKKMTCWRCGSHHISEYIREIEECSWNRLSKIVNQFQEQEYRSKKRPDSKYENESVKLPVGCSSKLSQSHIAYLEKRRFDPKKSIEKYSLMACNNVGKFKFRIIIPIFQNNRMVSYVGRDITEQAKLKYLNSTEEDSIIPVKSSLYAVNPIRDTAVIVEGIFDAWRIGKGAIATLGIQFSKEQVLQFKELGLKRVFIMYDGEPEAIKQAHKLAYALGAIVPDIQILELDEGDPDSLSDQDVFNLKRDIGLI